MIRGQISGVGQPYYDKPVMVSPKRALFAPAAVAVRQAFDIPHPRPVKIGHERVMLKWVKPQPSMRG